MKLLPALVLLTALTASADIVEDVRAEITNKDFAKAEAILAAYRAKTGVTPEWILAVSWMGRGNLARKDYAGAEKFANQTYTLATAELKKRPLDKEPALPLALGAAIEVQGNVFAGRGERSQAVAYLSDELKKYEKTSIRARIQKNILLLSLEGKPAPAAPGVVVPKGKPTILFFWAHWCPDCKREAPILARLKNEFGAKGLTVVAPTQKYGYAAAGEDAPPVVEVAYIEKIRKEFYSSIIPAPAIISEQAFLNYGASSTPTVVLVDRAGIVRTYHPGDMTYEELRVKVLAIL